MQSTQGVPGGTRSPLQPPGPGLQLPLWSRLAGSAMTSCFQGLCFAVVWPCQTSGASWLWGPSSSFPSRPRITVVPAAPPSPQSRPGHPSLALASVQTRQPRLRVGGPAQRLHPAPGFRMWCKPTELARLWPGANTRCEDSVSSGLREVHARVPQQRLRSSWQQHSHSGGRPRGSKAVHTEPWV